MTNIQDHVQRYIDAYARGVADASPKQTDAVSLRGYRDGAQTRKIAVEQELERLGINVGPDTLSAISKQDVLEVFDLTAAAITETAEPMAIPTTAPTTTVVDVPTIPTYAGETQTVSPMLQNFMTLRERHLAKLSVPDGTTFPTEYLPDGERALPQPGRGPVKHRPIARDGGYASHVLPGEPGPLGGSRVAVDVPIDLVPTTLAEMFGGASSLSSAVPAGQSPATATRESIARLTSPDFDTRDLVNPYPLD